LRLHRRQLLLQQQRLRQAAVPQVLLPLLLQGRWRL
jgi:hypothetical protein